MLDKQLSEARNLFTTLAVMESKLNESIANQKTLHNDISELTKEIQLLKLKVNSLELNDNSCNENIGEQLKGLRICFNKLEKNQDEIMQILREHQKTIDDYNQKKKNSENIKNTLLGETLKWLLILLLTSSTTGIVVNFFDRNQQRIDQNTLPNE